MQIMNRELTFDITARFTMRDERSVNMNMGTATRFLGYEPIRWRQGTCAPMCPVCGEREATLKATIHHANGQILKICVCNQCLAMGAEGIINASSYGIRCAG